MFKRLPKGIKPESRIESFLEKNVDLIEPGLKLISRQYPLHSIVPKMVGKIDLFCVGCDGAEIASELLSGIINSNDLGQTMTYWNILKKRSSSFKIPEPRIYLIGAGVSSNFLNALNVLDGGKMINLTVKIFKVCPWVQLEDEAWEVELENYDPRLRIKFD